MSPNEGPADGDVVTFCARLKFAVALVLGNGHPNPVPMMPLRKCFLSRLAHMDKFASGAKQSKTGASEGAGGKSK